MCYVHTHILCTCIHTYTYYCTCIYTHVYTHTRLKSDLGVAGESVSSRYCSQEVQLRSVIIIILCLYTSLHVYMYVLQLCKHHVASLLHTCMVYIYIPLLCKRCPDLVRFHSYSGKINLAIRCFANKKNWVDKNLAIMGKECHSTNHAHAFGGIKTKLPIRHI